ncbi:MAG: hypothetical protein HKN26_01450 [Acidimicrobiales bacterium]|nr:hypothetical protein [Acidimicrobiales bacterium]
MPARTAWLVDLDTTLDGVGLCPTHLNRFSVPMGWTLFDERSGSITSIEPPAPEPILPEPAAPDPHLHEPARLDPDPSAAPDVRPSEPAATAAALEEQGAEAEAPTGRWDGPARADTVAGPAAESPLLARAFGGPDDSPRRLAFFERQPPEEPDDDTLPFPPDGPATVPGS